MWVNKMTLIRHYRRKNPKCEYPVDWNRIRGQVYKRDGDTCRYCGERTLGRNAHHIADRSDRLSNLVCVCDKCHSILHPINPRLEDKYVNRLIYMDLLDDALYQTFSCSSNGEMREYESEIMNNFHRY
jgi:hypothetical protein